MKGNQAVRDAVEKALRGVQDSAQTTRVRAKEIADEVIDVAAHVRQTAGDVGLVDEVKALRQDLSDIAKRLSALEQDMKSPAAKRTQAKATRTKPVTAKTRSASTAAKTAKSPGAKRSTTAKASRAKKSADR